VTANPRRGRPAGLDRDAILDAAQARAESGGVDGVSMRGLAADLGVSPMAVYRHFADKDTLLVAVLDRQVASLRRPRLPADPGARVVRLMAWLHSELESRPWVVDALTRGDMFAPRVLPTIEEVLAAFVAGGLTPRAAVVGYQACWRYIVGDLVIRHRSAATAVRLDREPIQTASLRRPDPEVLPLLAATASVWPGARAAHDIRIGLRALVGGLLDS
jgi:AcrR family transcriptional regulator